jgi:hypothetical protein
MTRRALNGLRSSRGRPAHVKHRVAKATADAVWLALHYMEDTERVK